MARIRPRAHRSVDPGTVAGRPLTGAVETPDDALDDLAGAEAFGPRPEGDPDDPFSHAYVEGGRRGGAGGPARTGIVLAALVCVAGLLALLVGVADDDEEVDGDDIATVATSTSTSRPAASTSTTARSTTTSAPGGSTSTTSGFAPGTTPTTRRTTITTLRPSTTLPAATTTAPDRPLDIAIELLDEDRAPLAEPMAGQRAVVRVIYSDADAEPTAHCQRITVNDSVLFEDPCEPRDCPSTFAPGGERVLEFNYTFLTAGTYSFLVEATSGFAECGDRGASEGRDDTFEVQVR